MSGWNLPQWNLRWKMAAALVAGVAAAASSIYVLKPRPVPSLRFSIAPQEIAADGFTSAIATIASETAPQVTVASGNKVVTIGAVRKSAEGQWQATIRSGIAPGPLMLRAEVDGAAAEARLTLTPYLSDRHSDGTPDALRLDTDADREAFRRWFTFLAEAQFFQTPSLRPSEINDCAALIRYSYRESLKKHDAAWVAEARLPIALGLEPVRKYQYPRTLLGASLFRIKDGKFVTSDLEGASFSQFADAKTLHERNTYFISRDLNRAQPGDLLFYRHLSATMPYHTMIYLGTSQIEPAGDRYLLYHTGPDGSNPGEMRRPSVEQLNAHPDPSWRPLAGNPAFLGVFRWNILR